MHTNTHLTVMWLISHIQIRLINLKRRVLHLAGTKNSNRTDQICFWSDVKIFAEIEFRQKRIIPFSCSSYFVSESYLTNNTNIFFWLSNWLGNIDSSPKHFVRFLFPPNVKHDVLDLSVLNTCYSQESRVPAWCDLVRSLAGLGSNILPFSPVQLMQ
jgi:hypothetical protein